MSYENEIFLSYRRTPTVGNWVRNHFYPRLKARLDENAASEVRVFCDFNMDDGVNLPAELHKNIKRSSLLLSVWSADYFRSTWCMAEWQSFRQREQALGLSTEANPASLIYPVRYSDGNHYHADAKFALIKKDFSELNYPDDVFRNSVKYLDFDQLVQQMAIDLVGRLGTVPAWNAQFPYVAPQPLAPAVMGRPVI